MTLPQTRRYSTGSTTGTNNVWLQLEDDLSGQAQFTIFQPNVIIDVLNDPDPTSGVRIEYQLLKNGIETPVKVFSGTISPGNAGRMAVGPINISPGQYIWTSKQVSGTAEAKSMVVKYASPLM